MTIQGPNAAENSPEQRLRIALREWERLTDLIRSSKGEEEISGTIGGDPAREVREARREAADTVRSIVSAHPGLREIADRNDFPISTGTQGINAGEEQANQGTPSNDNNDGGGDAGGNRPPSGNTTPPPTKPDKDKDKDKDKDDSGVDGDLLPGERGKHYDVVRHNGKTYVVYKVSVGGRTVGTAWRVKPGDLDKHQLEDGDGRQITRAQFKRLQVFGTSDEITRRKGGNKHPFKKWIEELEATYGGASILKNKETLGILIGGFLEREDPGITEAKLRQTKWYQTRTAYEREWEMVKTKEEREQTLKRTSQDIKLSLDELYGNVNWRKYIDDDQVDKWALKIASGKWDDPGGALSSLVSRQMKKAEKIEGTAAWQSKQEEVIAGREFANRPEEMFEQVRLDAITMLGPRARFDKEILKKWAEDLAFGRKSNADWQQHLRRTKQALYPYLDPDEAWQDRASTYKNLAEGLLGRTLNWNDRLLSDFTATKPDGTPIGDGRKALSSWDFEKRVRQDKRFLTGKLGYEEGFGLYNMLNETFNGVTA